jgi:hypothetical protein
MGRSNFESLVARHGAERYSKGFSCWTQLVAMLFSQLARADSLREICNGMACCLGKLVHLGVDGSPSRSTLSYANVHRPAKLSEDLFWTTAERFRKAGMLGQHKPFRFKNKLLSLNSTTISLCLRLFPWASFRRAKGGVKLHFLLSHDDYLPEYILMTEARRNDIRPARQLQPGHRRPRIVRKGRFRGVTAGINFSGAIWGIGRATWQLHREPRSVAASHCFVNPR